MKNTEKKEKINLSEVEGSVSNIIINWWNDYDFSNKTPQQVHEDVYKLIPEDRIEEPKVQQLMKSLKYAKNSEQSAIAIGNFVLRGDNLSTLHGFKDKERKFMKNFGR